MAQEELVILFWLLKYCNGDLTKCVPFEEALPAAASEMDTLGNIGAKLDQRNIDSLLSHWLNALSNKKAKLLPNMIAYAFCSFSVPGLITLHISTMKRTLIVFWKGCKISSP